MRGFGTGARLQGFAGEAAPVTAGEFGAWAPIGAEKTATGYEVAWKVAGVDLYGIWYTDNNGNYVSSPAGGQRSWFPTTCSSKTTLARMCAGS